MSKAIHFHSKINEKTETPLKRCDRFPEAAHKWSLRERDAITLALASGRPLLVRGEAGSGKSQLARAAKEVLQADLLVEVVDARFEASDLKYRLDLVKRLADAELGSSEACARVLNWHNYLDHGIYWRACDLSNEDKGVVLLIDEIDKADSDIPNALLDVLGNGSFEIPYLDKSDSDKKKRINPKCPPLVIITTNEDRELPAAFVRRCVVLNQNPPDSEKEGEKFKEWLTQRGNAHDYLEIDSGVAQKASAMVLVDRNYALDKGYPPVGLAEYIDLLRALSDLSAGDAEGQQQWLERLRGYALIKQRDLDQQRHTQSKGE